jgi:hypothetical protein
VAQARDPDQPNSRVPHGIARDNVTLDLDADAQRTMAWIASLGGPDQ